VEAFFKNENRSACIPEDVMKFSSISGLSFITPGTDGLIFPDYNDSFPPFQPIFVRNPGKNPPRLERRAEGIDKGFRFKLTANCLSNTFTGPRI